MYSDPPIVCHHDERQTGLDRSRFGGNVSFVLPSIRTGWAKWSLVEAALLGFKQLHERAAPEWYALLSAADYPVAAAATVLHDLNDQKADVLIDYRPVYDDLRVSSPPGEAEWLRHHGSLDNLQLAKRRFINSVVRVPFIRLRNPEFSTSLEPRVRLGRHTINVPFQSPFSPFRQRLTCFVGSQWFTANLKAVERLLSNNHNFKALSRHLRARVCPDECFFQSFFLNEPDLVIDENPRRYADWGKGGAHPHVLTQSDLNAVIASGAHFARKFSPDDPILDRLDEMHFDMS